MIYPLSISDSGHSVIAGLVPLNQRNLIRPSRFGARVDSVGFLCHDFLMAKVFFTTNLRRHVGCAEVEARGDTVREEIPEWRQAETMKEPLDCVSAQDEIKTGVLCPG